MSNSWSTLKRARSLGERHPDAPPSVKLVALYLATYAEGKYGTRIYPGEDVMCQELGVNRRTVSRAIEWLIAHDELRRDNQGRRGSRAQFTYLGVGTSEAAVPHWPESDDELARQQGSRSEAAVPRPSPIEAGASDRASESEVYVYSGADHQK